MSEFVHSADPPRRPRARAIPYLLWTLPAGSVGPVGPARCHRQRDVLGPGVDPGDFLYQGMDPNAGGDHISPPWRTGLLTQTNSPC